MPYDVVGAISGTEDVGASHLVSWTVLFAAIALLGSWNVPICHAPTHRL